MQAPGDRPTTGGLLLQHIIVFLICVAFPGGVTMIAPATWLTFERNGEVHCTARTCVFFVVPFKQQEVDQVTEITSRERAGRTERQREFGSTRKKDVHVDGEGFLQIHGTGDQVAEVSVSPASLASVVQSCNEFLNSTEAASKTMFVVANWKFGVLMGGVLTSLTLLYVVGYSLSLLKWIFMGTKKVVSAISLNETE